MQEIIGHSLEISSHFSNVSVVYISMLGRVNRTRHGQHLDSKEMFKYK